MSYTTLQLANRAIVKLGVVGTGQSPEAEDTTKVEAVVPAVIADLEARNIISIPDADDIDDAIFEWLADCLAYFVATDFAQPRDEIKRQMAERMLQWINSSEPTYQPLQAEHF